MRWRIPSWVWTDAVLPFVLTRLVLLLVAFLTLQVIEEPWDMKAWHVAPGGVSRGVEAAKGLPLAAGDKLVDPWARWDTGWYLSIAESGYSRDEGAQSSVTFFPMYPLLIKWFAGWPEGKSPRYVWSGWLISNAALLCGLVVLVGWLRREWDEGIARRTAWYLLVFPTSFFFSSVYSEGLFLLATVCALFQARNGRWLSAGGWGCVAALTRPPGFLLVIPLFVEYMAQRGWRCREVRGTALFLLLPVAGLGLYMAFLSWRFGDPLAFLHDQAKHSRQLSMPWDPFVEFFRSPRPWAAQTQSWMDLAFAVFGVAGVVWCWFRLPAMYSVFATVMMLLPLFAARLGSMPRFVLAAFPIFIVMAMAGKRSWVDQWILISGIGLSALFFAHFTLWYWVA